jgi:hypothetical protein
MVTGELCKWHVLLPICAKSSESTRTEHVFENLVNPFHLITGVGVTSCAEGEPGVHSSLEAFSKARGEK